MILIAVIVGYALGITPFLYKEISKKIENKQVRQEEKKEQNEAEEIFSEWLNGEKQKNQADIYEEYMTGEEKNKED